MLQITHKQDNIYVGGIYIQMLEQNDRFLDNGKLQH